MKIEFNQHTFNVQLTPTDYAAIFTCQTVGDFLVYLKAKYNFDEVITHFQMDEQSIDVTKFNLPLTQIKSLSLIVGLRRLPNDPFTHILKWMDRKSINTFFQTMEGSFQDRRVQSRGDMVGLILKENFHENRDLWPIFIKQPNAKTKFIHWFQQGNLELFLKLVNGKIKTAKGGEFFLRWADIFADWVEAAFEGIAQPSGLQKLLYELATPRSLAKVTCDSVFIEVSIEERSIIEFTYPHLLQSLKRSDIARQLQTAATSAEIYALETQWKRSAIREKKGVFYINCSGMNFSSKDLKFWEFQYVNFKRANFRQANLEHARFFKANLSEVDLSKSNLRSADLNRTNLSRANFNEADLLWAVLSETDLSETDFSKSNLHAAWLNGANLIRTNFNEANLLGANFREVDLRRITLRGASLREAILIRANLSWVDLRGATLSRANFSRANLIEANLNEANLDGASLREANLSGAKLRAAYLRAVNLKEAKLNQVDMTDANLTDTDISQVDLTVISDIEQVIPTIKAATFTFLKRHIAEIQRANELDTMLTRNKNGILYLRDDFSLAASEKGGVLPLAAVEFEQAIADRRRALQIAAEPQASSSSTQFAVEPQASSSSIQCVLQ